MNPKVLDAFGVEVDDDTVYIATLDLSDDLHIVIRKVPEDIDVLVRTLKLSGVTDERLLDPVHWLTSVCSESRNKPCGGDCPKRGASCTKKSAGPYKICNCWDD